MPEEAAAVLAAGGKADSGDACQVAGRDLTRAEWAGLLPSRPYRHGCPH
jgi:hypothetical protein